MNFVYEEVKYRGHAHFHIKNYRSQRRIKYKPQKVGCELGVFVSAPETVQKENPTTFNHTKAIILLQPS